MLVKNRNYGQESLKNRNIDEYCLRKNWKFGKISKFWENRNVGGKSQFCKKNHNFGKNLKFS